MRKSKPYLLFAVIRLALALLAACKPAESRSKKLKVTCTTTMVTDLVKSVAGDHAEVEGLMGPGVDPHLYKATQSDVAKLSQADVIFYNGLLLEGKMQDLFAKMARTKKFVYAITEGVPVEQLMEPPEFEGHYDPHVWFEIPLWELCMESVVRGLGEADPANKASYEKRGQELRAQFRSLHQWALNKVAELPESKRVLITSHDAFNYFGRAYGFQVVGLQGISTVTEAGIADMAQMVDFIKEKKVKAIFVESSVAHNTIERVSKDAGVKIGGELFSDAMGTPGEMENGYDLGTYEGMIRHNVNTVVKAEN